MAKKLTPKQENFVLKYFECGNATEAYKFAYNASKMKDETIWAKSSKLLKEDKVSTRLNELKAKAEAESQWNVQKLIEAHTEIFEIGIGRTSSPHTVTEGAGDGITNTIEVDTKDTNLAGAKGALVEIGKLIGAYEKDNKQKSGEISIADFAEMYYKKKLENEND